MDIELGTPVFGSDGRLGSVEAIVMHPKEERVTHLVVRHGHLFAVSKVVPVEIVAEAKPARVLLRLDRAGFDRMPDFLTQHFTNEPPESLAGPLRTIPPDGVLWPSTLVGWYLPAEVPEPTSFVEENLPPGELPLKTGTEVYATDGKVGHVEEVCFDRASGRASSLVVRRGFLFHRDVTLPIEWVAGIGERVRLNRSKAELERFQAETSGHGPGDLA